MAKKKLDLDLNGDGVFDKKDKSIAAKALATKIDEGAEVSSPKQKVVKKEVVVEESVVEGRLLVRDISPKYRAGSIVPLAQIELWKKSGINYEIWF